MPYTAESMATTLKQMNRDYYGRRTWAQQFAGVDFSKQLALEGLKSDYGASVGAAYDTAFGNRTALQMSNLIEGNKAAAIEANDLALQEAYDAYIKNYQSGAQTIEQNALEQMSNINADLIKQGEMFSRYANSHIDYLYDLWNKRESGEIEGTFFDDPRFSNYMQYQYDENGNIVTNEGIPVQSIIDRGQLENILFEPNGSLTLAGRSFFEQMEYDELLRGNSFSNYLSETDNELYQWAKSSNPYDYAPNAMGLSTMAGTFNKMTGRESDDEVFEAADMFAGATEGTFSALFGSANNALNDLSDALDSGKNLDTAVTEFSTEINKLVTTLGLGEELLAEINKDSADEYATIYAYIKDIVKDYTESDAENEVEALKYGAGMAGVFGAVGLAGGPLVAAITAGVGALTGAAYGAIKDYQNSKVQDKIKNETKNEYAQLVSTLVNYAANKRGQIERDFYGKEMSTGGTIQAYDPLIAKHDTYYDYGLKNGQTATFLSSATSVASKVKDRTGDDFVVKYGDIKFNLEAGSKTLDASVVKQLSEKVQSSMGRPIQQGDVFKYDGQLWIATTEGTIRRIKSRRIGNASYDFLLGYIDAEDKNAYKNFIMSRRKGTE